MSAFLAVLDRYTLADLIDDPEGRDIAKLLGLYQDGAEFAPAASV